MSLSAAEPRRPSSLAREFKVAADIVVDEEAPTQEGEFDVVLPTWKGVGAARGWSVHEGRSGEANVSKPFPVKLGGLFRSKEEAMAAARCWAGGGSTDECHGTGSKRGVGGVNRGRPKKGVDCRDKGGDHRTDLPLRESLSFNHDVRRRLRHRHLRESLRWRWRRTSWLTLRWSRKRHQLRWVADEVQVRGGAHWSQ